MKTNTFFTLTILFLLIAVSSGCATYSQVTESVTANRQAASIMNAESAANGMDSARCGRNYVAVAIGAEVNKVTEATTDYDSARRQGNRSGRFNNGRIRSHDGFNGRNNQPHREVFYDSSMSQVSMTCVRKDWQEEES